MGPLKYEKNETQKKSSFPRQLFLYFLLLMCPASLKFDNEAHLGHIRSSEAGFVQCFERYFCVATYRRNDLISAGGLKKKNLQKNNKNGTFSFFVLP